MAIAEREWQIMASNICEFLHSERIQQVQVPSASPSLSRSSRLQFQKGSDFYLNGAVWLRALLCMVPKLTVKERLHAVQHSLYLADLLARREWPSVDKSQWLDSELPILLIWEWACDSLGALLFLPESNAPAFSAIIHLIDSVTSRDADSSSIRMECIVDLIRKLSACKSTWQSGGGYCLLSKLLLLASSTPEPLRIIELHFAIDCIYSMMPCCRACAERGFQTRTEWFKKRSCCDASAVYTCSRSSGANSASLNASLSQFRSSVYSIYNVACARIAILLPPFLMGQGFPFFATNSFDCDALCAKIRDIFVNVQFPEAVLKLRLFIEGLKPKWNTPVQHISKVKYDTSTSSALPSVEFPIPARCSPATAGEQAAICLYNGDVDGSVFNALLMMLVVFEGSNHFGSATSIIEGGLNHGNTESSKNSESNSSVNFTSDDHLPSFSHSCHASSVIAAVLRSFRFRGGIDKRSCSLAIDLIPRAVFLWLSQVPSIPFSFSGASYDPAKTAAALISCVAKGLISFGSFVVWLLYPALQYRFSNLDRTKVCRRLLALAASYKRTKSHLEIESPQWMSQAIENSAKNEVAVELWLELIRIVSNSQVGGSHSGIVSEWDAKAVHHMLNDVELLTKDELGFSLEEVAPSISSVNVVHSQKSSAANQIARIMKDASLHGTKDGTNGSTTCRINCMSRLSSLFYSHVLACTTCDPFENIDQDASSPNPSHIPTDSFIANQLQEIRETVSSSALSDALIFAQNYDNGSLSSGKQSDSGSDVPSLQTVIAAHYMSAQFISRVSEFFTTAVEVGLLLVGSGIISVEAAATILHKLCPTLASRYFNHVLMLIPAADLKRNLKDTSLKLFTCEDDSPLSPVFAPLDHALPLFHQSACCHNFHAWARISASHAASALRLKNSCTLSIFAGNNSSSALHFDAEILSIVAHHCSSISVSALLRHLHVEYELGATFCLEVVGETLHAKQHELVYQLQEWICKYDASNGVDEGIINSNCSRMSMWRCEAFRALNCSFMNLACNPSLILSSVGVVASRISAFDLIFQDLSAFLWQQATTRFNPASAGIVLGDKKVKSLHMNKISRNEVQTQVQHVSDDEDISLTDDEYDCTSCEEAPNSAINRNLIDHQSQQYVETSSNSYFTDVHSNISNDSCWQKLHAAVLLLPTAVSRH
jgi:hypothetical protein